MSWLTEIGNAAPTYEKPYQWNKTITAYNDSEKNSDGSWDEETCDVHYHISAVRGSSAITFAILCADTIKPTEDYLYPIHVLRTDSGAGTSAKCKLYEAKMRWGVELTTSGIDNATVEADEVDSQINLENSTITKDSVIRLTLKLGTNIVAEKEVRGVADGNSPVIVYWQSVSKPTKPSGTLEQVLSQGWTQEPIDKNDVRISNNGAFSVSADGFRKSPATGNNGSSTEILTVVTTKANQAVGILLRSSSEQNYDFGYVGTLDASDATTSYAGRVSGINVDSLIQVNIPSAGTHTIRITYKKDATSAKGDDCIYYKTRKIKNWQSKAIYDYYGNITGWSDPYTSDSDDGANGVNGDNGKDSTSYWLDSIVGCINFTHAGYPSPNSFVVSAKQKKGEDAVTAASFYFKCWAYNGSTCTPINISWDGGSGSSYTNKKVSQITVAVSATTQYKQYLIKAFDTQPTATTAATADAICEKAIGVAIDGESIRGERGDSIIPTDRGFWQEGRGYFYKKIGNEVIRDKVVCLVGNRYYNFVVKNRDDNTTTGITSKPTLANGSAYDGSGGDDNWELTSVYQLLVADTMFANNANIGGFVASNQMLVSQAVAYIVEYAGNYDSSKAYVYEENKPYTVRYRGTYSSANTYTYTTGDVIDIVFYNSKYYAVKVKGDSVTNTIPTSTTKWRNVTSEEMAVINKGVNGTLTIDHQLMAPKNYLVYYNNEYYVINQPKGVWFQNYIPTNKTYWRVASTEERKCVDEGVGGQVLMRYLNLDGVGGIIKVLHSDGYKWEVTQQGIQILGIETGRHIEIDPSVKEIRIYDDSGVECANFNGETYETMDKIFGTTTPNFYATTQGRSGNTGRIYGTNGAWSQKTGNVVISNVQKTGAGRMTIRGSIAAYSSRYQVYITQEQTSYDMIEDHARYYVDRYGNYYEYDIVMVYCRVVTYSDEACTKQISCRNVGVAYGYGEQQKNTRTFSGTVNVPEGYQRVEVYYEMTLAPHNYGGSLVYWEFTETYPFLFAADFYLSRVFANGFAYGNNANNIVAAVNETMYSVPFMHFKAVNNDAKSGLELDYYGLKRIFHTFTSNWPMTLLVVRGTYSNKAVSLTLIYRFDGSYINDFTITRSGEGNYKITLPATWKSGGARGISIGLYNTFVTIMGYKNRLKGTIDVLDSNGIEFTMTDDSSPNDGDFFLKIDYYAI